MQDWKSWFKNKVLPHIVALVLFAGVSALFFAPQFEGKILKQGDMVRAAGMGQDIKEHIDKYGEHPQWAGNMFSGMPAYMIDMNYDGRLAKQVGDKAYFLGKPAGWIFVAMAGFYLMLLLFGVNPWLSITGGLGYGLSSYFIIIIGAGHITKMLALAWISPMIGAIWYAYRRRMWMGAALAGVFAAIEIATSHLQIPYYFLFVILALVINEFIRAYKEKTLAQFGKVSATLLLAATLAIGANLVQLYYVAEHADDTIRGKSELTELADSDNQTSGLDKDYATEWSYGKIETLNLLVPNLYGGGSEFSDDGPLAEVMRKYQVPKEYAAYLPSYWGPQRFTEGPVYIGAALIFLAILALFVLRGREKWWIVGVSILALFLAWGRHMMWFTDLFLDYFPMYNKFRTVSMILVILEWSIPLLAILGLQRIWNSKSGIGDLGQEQIMKGLKWSTIAVGGLCLLIGALGIALDTSVFSKTGEEATIVRMFGLEQHMQDSNVQQMIAEMTRGMQLERASLMRADGFRSLAIVLLAAALVWLWMKGKIKNALFVTGTAALVTFDLFNADRRYLSEKDFHKAETLAVPMTEADKQILRDTTDYRVANFTTDPFMDPTNATAYYHRSVGGYHAAKLRRYNELISYHLGKSNMAAYDMLNTKYFIVTGRDGKPTAELNPEACGSAWYVDRIDWVSSPDEELKALSGFDPHTTAIVDRSRFENAYARAEQATTATDSLASVRLEEYRTNRLTYKTRSSEDGVIVFSEIYYPKGWTITLDGQPADYFRANYVLRAMVVPAGEHTIVFSFAAPHFRTLVWITRICSLILLLGALGIATSLTVKSWQKRAA